MQPAREWELWSLVPAKAGICTDMQAAQGKGKPVDSTAAACSIPTVGMSIKTPVYPMVSKTSKNADIHCLDSTHTTPGHHVASPELSAQDMDKMPYSSSHALSRLISAL